MPVSLILNVGQDPSLLETRSALLRAAGYIVESVLSIRESISHFQAGDFDLVVLCHTIPQKDGTSSVPDSGLRITNSRRHRRRNSRTAKGCHRRRHDRRWPERGSLRYKEILMTAAAVRAGSRAQRASGAYGNANHKTVLSIDDDTNLLAIRRRILENAGYIVLTANGGSDGLKVFSQRSCGLGPGRLFHADYEWRECRGAHSSNKE